MQWTFFSHISYSFLQGVFYILSADNCSRMHRKWMDARSSHRIYSTARCCRRRQHRHLRAAAAAAAVPCSSELGCIANWISDVIAALINASACEPDIADHRRFFTAATATHSVHHTRRYVKTTAHTKSVAVLLGFPNSWTATSEQDEATHEIILHDSSLLRLVRRSFESNLSE